MIERPQQEIASVTAEIDEAAHAGLIPQLGMMFRALLSSPVRNLLALLGVAVVRRHRRDGLRPESPQ